MKSRELFPAIFSRYAAGYKQRLDEIMARGEAADDSACSTPWMYSPECTSSTLPVGPAR